MKGILKIFEALIAASLLAIVYLSLFKFQEEIPESEIVIWKKRGFEALKVLDNLNRLANYALNNETERIESELAPLLPIGVNYKAVVCYQECSKIDVDSEKVTSVSYFIAGNVTHVEPREILLYMWGWK